MNKKHIRRALHVKVMFKVISVVPLFLAIALVTTMSTSADASGWPHCSVGTVDSDGNGLEWQNNNNCIIVGGQYDNCVSNDGGDWGWTYLENKGCQVSTYTYTPDTNPDDTFDNSTGWVLAKLSDESNDSYLLHGTNSRQWLDEECTDKFEAVDFEFTSRQWSGDVETTLSASSGSSCDEIFVAMVHNSHGWILAKLSEHANDSYLLHGTNSRQWLDDECTDKFEAVYYEFTQRQWTGDVETMTSEGSGSNCDEIFVVMTNDHDDGSVPSKFAEDPYGIFDDSLESYTDGHEWSDDDIYDSYSWAGHDADTSQVVLNSNFNGAAQMNNVQARYFSNFSSRQARIAGDKDNDGVKDVSSDPGIDEPNFGLEGSFRIHCGVSHFQQVDPILDPGEKSGHLHMFWGNTETDENSIVGGNSDHDIAQNGQSNCQGGPYNRSAYWMPALLDSSTGVDRVVIPNDVFVYYKSKVKTQLRNLSTTDDRENWGIEKVNTLPMGIQLLGGNINLPGDQAHEGTDFWNKSDNANGAITEDQWNGFSKAMVDPANSRHNLDFVNWGCYSGEGIPHTLFPYIPSSETCRTSTSPGKNPGCSNATTTNADGSCKRYTYLEAQIRFPQCLAVNPDGTPKIASTDKVSHMYARMSYNKPETYFCPESHPYRIPQITYRVRFHIPGSQNWEAESNQQSYNYSTPERLLATINHANDTLKDFRLSSDDHPTKPTVDGALDPSKRGWSLHGDWLGAWNDDLVKHWVDGCLDQDETNGWNRKARNCANGQMSNPEQSGSEFGLRHFVGKHVIGSSMKYDGHNHPEKWTRPIPAGGVVNDH